MAILEAAGAHLHPIDMRRAFFHPANAAGIIRLRRLIHQLQPSVVHGHSSIGGGLSRIAAIGGPPVVYTPNGIAPGALAWAIERTLGRLTSRFIAVSESEAAAARTRHLARPGLVVTVPNGIDLTVPDAAEDLRARLGVPPGAALVGTVIRLVDQKAPEQFVSVCARVARKRPDAHFLLVGMGPLQPEVDDAVERSSLGDRWHQIESHPAAAALLAQLDVFVLVSRFEGGPYTPLEAMRAGTPVVLSDVVGNRDAIEDGSSGLLVPFGDPDAAAIAVAGLLDDPAWRQSLTDGATLRLHREFDVRLMGARLADLYRQVAVDQSLGRRSTRRLPHARLASSTNAPDTSASR